MPIQPPFVSVKKYSSQYTHHPNNLGYNHCYTLQPVTLPATITEVEEEMPRYCFKLKTVNQNHSFIQMSLWSSCLG